MDYPILRKLEAWRYHYLASLASARCDALEFEEHFEASALMDEAIDTSAAAHQGVGRVHDYIGIEIEEGAPDDGDNRNRL